MLDDAGETLGLISFDEPDECPASPDIPDEHAKGNANTARSDLLSQQFQTLRTKRQRQSPRNTKLVQKRNVQGPEGQNTNTRTHPAPANVLPVQPASRLPLFHDIAVLLGLGALCANGSIQAKKGSEVSRVGSDPALM